MNTRILAASLLSLATTALFAPQASADVINAKIVGDSVDNAIPGKTYDLVKVNGPGKFVWADISANGVGVIGYARVYVDGVAVLDANFDGNNLDPHSSNDPVQHLIHNNPGYPVVQAKMVPSEAIAYRTSLVITFKVYAGSAPPLAIGASALTGDFPQ